MNMLAAIEPKSDQINADDLIGKNLTIRIREVKFSGGTEQPVSMYFDGSDKAYRPCKSMCRVLVAAWGPDAKQYVGRSMTLYRDPTVKWGGLAVGGIRIGAMSHIDSQLTMALTATKGAKKAFTVKPLQAKQEQQHQQSSDGGQQGAKRQTPLEWTDEYVAKIEAIPTLDALIALQSRSKKALASLEADHAALHQRAVDAGTKRAAELQPATVDDDNPFAEVE